jgi:hypothetical protein
MSTDISLEIVLVIMIILILPLSILEAFHLQLYGFTWTSQPVDSVTQQYHVRPRFLLFPHLDIHSIGSIWRLDSYKVMGWSAAAPGTNTSCSHSAGRIEIWFCFLEFK